MLGPTTGANASTAIAGSRTGAFSPLNFAIAVGSANDHGTTASAGEGLNAPGLPSIGNVAFATAGSHATSDGLFNLADSAGGTDSSVIAFGVANSALNIGSGNTLFSTGVVNNTTNLFGDGNLLGSSNVTPSGHGVGGASSRPERGV